MMLSSATAQVSAKEQPLETSNGYSKPVIKKAGARCVVMLDPGYGGIDIGAIGHNGLKERHVVLATVKNVYSILRSSGIGAHLTHTGDTFIPLCNRVGIVHQHGADLFMSIHADGFTNPNAADASVLALSNRGVSSAMVEHPPDCENHVDEVAGKKVIDEGHLLQQMLFNLMQTSAIKNSLTLGPHVLKKIKPVHKLHNRNIEQAVLMVLKSPSTPSVLAETSFITNPNEEKLFGTTAFRQKVVVATASGIVNCFHWFDNRKAHSGRRQ